MRISWLWRTLDNFAKQHASQTTTEMDRNVRSRCWPDFFLILQEGQSLSKLFLVKLHGLETTMHVYLG